MSDLVLIETVGNPLTGNFSYRRVISKVEVPRERLNVLNYPPISFNVDGFTRTIGKSQQLERIRELISSEYKDIPAPFEANALLLGNPAEHWENNLTFAASYCHVNFY